MISNIIFYNIWPSYAKFTSEKIYTPAGTGTQEQAFGAVDTTIANIFI